MLTQEHIYIYTCEHVLRYVLYTYKLTSLVLGHILTFELSRKAAEPDKRDVPLLMHLLPLYYAR